MKKCVVIVILVDINLSSPSFSPFVHTAHPDKREPQAWAERKNVYDNLTNPSIICSFACLLTLLTASEERKKNIGKGTVEIFTYSISSMVRDVFKSRCETEKI